MPTWVPAGNGTWNTAANWSGGVPNAIGATAIFNIGLSSGAALIDILNGTNMTVGTLNINLTNQGGLIFRGPLSGSATLTFNGGAGNAQVNIDSLAGSPNGFFRTLDANLIMVLATNTVFNVVNAGSIAQLGAPIQGAGMLIKTGTGTLEVNNSSNTFTGGMDIRGGIVDASGDGALGSGQVFLSNNGGFRSSGTVNQTIRTIIDATGTVGTGRILAATGETLTLTGSISHFSQGMLVFGSADDAGTIVTTPSLIGHNTIDSGYRIAGGTVRFGNTLSASNLFSQAAIDGLLEISAGGVLDTNGFATVISNLDFDGGTLRSSVGPLNVTVNDTYFAANSQTGTLEGTAGTDSLTINTQIDFSLSSLSLLNWTAGTDLITINGSAGANSIFGSTGRDTINGFDGNDYLEGTGGIDTINGGNGDDNIVLRTSNAGSFVDGGTNIDTLTIFSSVSLGSVSNFEAIQLAGGAVLTLTPSQFAGGFDLFSTLSGTGTISVTLAPGNTTFNGRGMAVTLGSAITMAVTGSSGSDSIKIALGATGAISAGAGVDQIVGGNLADTINGGNDIDKIRGGGGADILTGGSGADVFKYRSVSDSGLGANADTILDFVSGTDRINLSRIDTNPFLAGDQGFVFIDTLAFVNNGIAQIRWVDLGADLRVEADVNGDGVADMHIILQGAGAQTLSAGDFVL